MTEAQLQALGLKLPGDERGKLLALIAELEKAATMMHEPHPYAEEPVTAFRLSER